MRTQGVPTSLFVEPYNDEIENAPDPTTDPQSRSNFTSAEVNCGYSYANPYPDAAAVARGYRLMNNISPGFVLAADRNPGKGPGQNSRNHERRGQNVLYADYHVTWEVSTNVGLNGDEIYVNQNNVVNASLSGAGDTVLLPIDQ